MPFDPTSAAPIASGFDPTSAVEHKPEVGLGEDVARAAGSGLVHAATGAAWPFAAFTSGHLGEMISKYGSSYGRDYSSGPAIRMIGKAIGDVTGLSSAEDKLEQVSKDYDYEPQSQIGRYVKTGLTLAPAALGRVNSWFAWLSRVVAPTVASEKAGDFFKGTKYENAARMAGTLSGSLGEAVAEGAPNIAKALGSGSTQQRAANAIEKAAGGPIEVDPRQIVPGSNPTLAEAATEFNPNLSGIQRSAVAASKTGDFARAEASNHAARKAFFEQLAGTPGDIESLVLARKAVADPLREASFQGAAEADARGVDQLISRILKSPTGQRNLVNRELQDVRDKLQVENPLSERIADALDPVRAELAKVTTGAAKRADLVETRRLLISAQRGMTSEEELVADLGKLSKAQKIVGPIDNALRVIKSGDVGYQTDASQLYGIRQHIGDVLDRLNGQEGVSSTASAELHSVMKSLDKSIEAAAPGYRKYLDTFSELSKPIDRARYLQSLNLTDAMGNITLSKTKSALENTKAFRNEGGFHNAKSLSDDDMAALEALHDDLRTAEGVSRSRAQPEMYREAVGGRSLADRLPNRLGRYLTPEIAGATLGGTLGSALGHTEAGAAAGAGAGSIFGHAIRGQAADVAQEVEKMLLDPETYQRASQAAAATRAGASMIVPRLLSRAAPAAILAGQPGLINNVVEAREAGGGVKAGRPYVVGEKGPEVIIPDKDGTVIPNGDPGIGAEMYRTIGGAAADTVDAITGLGAWGVNKLGGLINHNPGLEGTDYGKSVPQPWASGNRLMREVIPMFSPAGIETTGVKVVAKEIPLAKKALDVLESPTAREAAREETTGMINRRSFLKGAGQAAAGAAVAATIPKALMIEAGPGLKEMLAHAQQAAAGHDAHLAAMNEAAKLGNPKITNFGGTSRAGDARKYEELAKDAAEKSGVKPFQTEEEWASETHHADQAMAHHDVMHSLNEKMRSLGVPEDMLPKPTVKPSLRSINKFTKDLNDDYVSSNVEDTAERLRQMHNLRGAGDVENPHTKLANDIGERDWQSSDEVEDALPKIVKESNRLAPKPMTRTQVLGRMVRLGGGSDPREMDISDLDALADAQRLRINSVSALEDGGLSPQIEKAHRAKIEAVNRFEKAHKEYNDAVNAPEYDNNKVDKAMTDLSDAHTDIMDHAETITSKKVPSEDLSKLANKAISLRDPDSVSYLPKGIDYKAEAKKHGITVNELRNQIQIAVYKKLNAK